MRTATGNTILLIVSLAVGTLILEAAYRSYLWIRYPERFVAETIDENLPPIGVYDRSLWEFDKDLGFRYAQADITLSHVDGDQVTSCTKIPTANARGNMGRIKGSWGEADLKIAVFGDSFAAFVTIDGITWPNVFQDMLEQRLGRSVNIVNFGRDGTGILQMFDMARAMLPKWKPDLVIISFTTDDLARARFWRTVNVIDGEMRVLTVPEPKAKADLLNSYETFILHPEATMGWCKSMSYKGRLDKIAREIQDKYIRFRKAESWFRVDLFTLKASFLYDRLMHRDPFRYARKEKKQTRWSTRLLIQDYAEDKRFVENVRFLQKLGIPYLFVHLPIYPEVIAGKEYLITDQGEKLLQSLERLNDKKVYGLLDFVEKPIDKPERMKVTPKNYHPSLWGMRFYARGVIEILLKNKHVTP